MLNENQELNFLDVLAMISFAFQMQNTERLATAEELHRDNAAAVEEIHKHFELQDKKIDKIIKFLEDNYANH